MPTATSLLVAGLLLLVLAPCRPKLVQSKSSQKVSAPLVATPTTSTQPVIASSWARQPSTSTHGSTTTVSLSLVLSRTVVTLPGAPQLPHQLNQAWPATHCKLLRFRATNTNSPPRQLLRKVQRLLLTSTTLVTARLPPAAQPFATLTPRKAHTPLRWLWSATKVVAPTLRRPARTARLLSR